MNGKSARVCIAALLAAAGLFETAPAQSKHWAGSATSRMMRPLEVRQEKQGLIQSDGQGDQRDGKTGPHAFWLQGGLGVASADISGRYWTSWEAFLHFNASAHFRRKHRLVSIGLDHQMIEAWEIKSWWASYGFVHSLPYLEASLSLGAGLTRWYYDSESSRGRVRSVKAPSLLAKAQVITHVKQILGLGLVLSGNVNNEASYVAGSIVLALGAWNL